jgi:hypothetical protein
VWNTIGEVERERLAREFVASALYLDLVILAGLAVVPAQDLPPGPEVAAIMLGTAAGLLAAHWLAFRLAAQVTADGSWTVHASREAAAQVAGGLLVVVLAATPFLLLEKPASLRWSLLALGALPALAGLAIGRFRGRTWPHSVVAGVVALAAAGLVVMVKIAGGH